MITSSGSLNTSLIVDGDNNNNNNNNNFNASVQVAYRKQYLS